MDVNVHPAKLEVKFSNEKPVFEAVYYAVRNALEGNCERPDMTLTQRSTVAAPHAFVPVSEGEAKVRVEQTTMQMPVRVEREEDVRFTDVQSVRERMESLRASSSVRYNAPSMPPPAVLPQFERAARERESASVTHAPSHVVPTYTPPVTVKEETVAPRASASEVAETLDWRIIGEAFHCYVIVERGEQLLLIDKHAAHERILFEELKKKLAGCERATQIMMLPIEIDFSSADIATLDLYHTEIEAIGFTYTKSAGKVCVDEIPAELSPAAAEALLMTLAASLNDTTADATIARDLLFEKALYQAACKAAIKGGREYPPEYTRELCAKLFALPDITVCPHGRPVAMTLSHANIDRQFRRS